MLEIGQSGSGRLELKLRHRGSKTPSLFLAFSLCLTVAIINVGGLYPILSHPRRQRPLAPSWMKNQLLLDSWGWSEGQRQARGCWERHKAGQAGHYGACSQFTLTSAVRSARTEEQAGAPPYSSHTIKRSIPLHTASRHPREGAIQAVPKLSPQSPSRQEFFQDLN